IIGAVLRYGLVLPFMLGYVEVIPGIIITLSKAYLAGLLLLLLIGLRQSGTVLIAAIGLMALDLLISVLLFSKSEVLIICVFVMMAVWHHSPGFKKLAIGSVAVVVAYVTIVPLVLYGREEILARYGTVDVGVPLEERLAVVQSYFSYGKV